MIIRLSLFMLISLMLSCSLLDKEEAQPAYIIVNETSVKDPGSDALVSSDIKDVWVFLDGANLGIYSPPTHVACLPERDVPELSLLAGIRENGIASSLVTYPMLQNYTLNLKLEAGENYDISPVFEYRNDVFVRVNEGFEKVGHDFAFDSDNDEKTFFQISSEVKKDGNNSAYLEVSYEEPFSEAGSSNALIGIPVDGNAVYLEIDYKSSCHVFIGLIGYQDTDALSDPLKSYFLGLKPTEEWKKIYVNLTTEFFNSGLPAYRIVLRAEHTGSDIDEKLFVDNVKLLHF